MTLSDDAEKIKDAVSVIARYKEYVLAILAALGVAGGGYTVYDRNVAASEDKLDLVMEQVGQLNSAVEENAVRQARMDSILFADVSSIRQELRDKRIADSVERSIMRQMHEQVKRLGQQNIYGYNQ